MTTTATTKTKTTGLKVKEAGRRILIDAARCYVARGIRVERPNRRSTEAPKRRPTCYCGASKVFVTTSLTFTTL